MFKHFFSKNQIAFFQIIKNNTIYFCFFYKISRLSLFCVNCVLVFLASVPRWLFVSFFSYFIFFIVFSFWIKSSDQGSLDFVHLPSWCCAKMENTCLNECWSNRRPVWMRLVFCLECLAPYPRPCILIGSVFGPSQNGCFVYIDLCSFGSTFWWTSWSDIGNLAPERISMCEHIACSGSTLMADHNTTLPTWLSSSSCRCAHIVRIRWEYASLAKEAAHWQNRATNILSIQGRRVCSTLCICAHWGSCNVAYQIHPWWTVHHTSHLFWECASVGPFQTLWHNWSQSSAHDWL